MTALASTLTRKLAARVFLDPNRIETFDGWEAYGGDRWKTVGWVGLELNRQHGGQRSGKC